MLFYQGLGVDPISTATFLGSAGFEGEEEKDEKSISLLKKMMNKTRYTRLITHHTIKTTYESQK